MEKLLRTCGIALGVLLAAGTAAAQGTVWVVAKDPGPGVDFTSVQAAVDAAADGDVVLIHPGTYSSSVTVDGKGLSLIAEEIGTVEVQGLVVRNLSASQELFARGIDAVSVPPLTLENNAGDVLIEDGSYELAAFFVAETPGASITGCDSVALVRCSFLGSSGSFFGPTLEAGDGITASGSFLHLYECFARGGRGGDTPVSGPDAGDGGNGATLTSCSLFASGTTFQGGDGGIWNAPIPFCPILPGDGGDGLVTDATSLPRFQLGSTFLGGAPGTADIFPCSGGGPQAGSPLVGPVSTLPGQPRTMLAASPVREGELSTSSYVGQPGDLVFGIWGIQQDHVFYQVFKGTTVPQVLAAVLLGTIPASGTLSFSLPLGNLPPGADSLSVYSQAVVLPTSAPLQLTNATGVVILDESF